MIVKRIYKVTDENNYNNITLVTDNVRHYQILNINNQKVINCKDKNGNALLHIDLDGRINDTTNPKVELDAPLGTSLLSLFILNDDGAILEAFQYGYDFTTQLSIEDTMETPPEQENSVPEDLTT